MSSPKTPRSVQKKVQIQSGVRTGDRVPTKRAKSTPSFSAAVSQVQQLLSKQNEQAAVEYEESHEADIEALIKDLETVNEALAAEKQQNEKQMKVVVRLQKQLVDKEKEVQKKERQNKVLEMKIDTLQTAVRQVAELKQQKDADDETIMLQKITIQDGEDTIASYIKRVSGLNDQLKNLNNEIVEMADDMKDLKSDLLCEHQKSINLEERIKVIPALRSENELFMVKNKQLIADKKELLTQIKLAEHHLEYKRALNKELESKLKYYRKDQEELEIRRQEITTLKCLLSATRKASISCESNNQLHDPKDTRSLPQNHGEPIKISNIHNALNRQQMCKMSKAVPLTNIDIQNPSPVAKDKLISGCLKLGDRVKIESIYQSGKLECGSVKFIGKLNSRDKRIYAGLHLTSPNGEGDGVCQKRRYFRSTEGHAQFVRLCRIKYFLSIKKGGFITQSELLKINYGGDNNNTVC